MACKPGSVRRLRSKMAIPLGRASLRASRDPPGRRSGNGSNTIPIWSCSRWGLPCRLRCRRRGALLPHPFNLAAAFAGRRYAFCGAVPQVALGGRYPSPCFRGARTFLQPPRRPAAIRPSDAPTSIGTSRYGIKGKTCIDCDSNLLHWGNRLGRSPCHGRNQWTVPAISLS